MKAWDVHTSSRLFFLPTIFTSLIPKHTNKPPTVPLPSHPQLWQQPAVTYQLYKEALQGGHVMRPIPGQLQPLYEVAFFTAVRYNYCKTVTVLHYQGAPAGVKDNAGNVCVKSGAGFMHIAMRTTMSSPSMYTLHLHHHRHHHRHRLSTKHLLLYHRLHSPPMPTCL